MRNRLVSLLSQDFTSNSKNHSDRLSDDVHPGAEERFEVVPPYLTLWCFSCLSLIYSVSAILRDRSLTCQLVSFDVKKQLTPLYSTSGF